MSQVRLVTARSPRRYNRSRADENMLRVFPGTSSSDIAGISNIPQQFYPNNSHLQNHHNNLHNQRLAGFRQSPHLLGFANTPSVMDMQDASMEDVQNQPPAHPNNNNNNINNNNQGQPQ